jgi:hypothetical protein
MKHDFKCTGCHAVTEHDIPFDDFPVYKSRDRGVICPVCGGDAYYQFNPSTIQISFAGDAWADKNYREKAYRKRRSAYMERRMRTNHKTPELIPNFEGEEAASWKEARDAARDAGKSTSTYEPLVQRERLRKNK